MGKWKREVIKRSHAGAVTLSFHVQIDSQPVSEQKMTNPPKTAFSPFYGCT